MAACRLREGTTLRPPPGTSTGAPCLLALLLQAQFAILPAPDPTNGWRDFVWNRYGAEIADCVLRARAAGKQSTCEIVVP